MKELIKASLIGIVDLDINDPEDLYYATILSKIPIQFVETGPRMKIVFNNSNIVIQLNKNRFAGSPYELRYWLKHTLWHLVGAHSLMRGKKIFVQYKGDRRVIDLADPLTYGIYMLAADAVINTMIPELRHTTIKTLPAEQLLSLIISALGKGEEILDLLNIQPKGTNIAKVETVEQLTLELLEYLEQTLPEQTPQSSNNQSGSANSKAIEGSGTAKGSDNEQGSSGSSNSGSSNDGLNKNQKNQRSSGSSAGGQESDSESETNSKGKPTDNGSNTSNSTGGEGNSGDSAGDSEGNSINNNSSNSSSTKSAYSSNDDIKKKLTEKLTEALLKRAQDAEIDSGIDKTIAEQEIIERIGDLTRNTPFRGLGKAAASILAMRRNKGQLSWRTLLNQVMGQIKSSEAKINKHRPDKRTGNIPSLKRVFKPDVLIYLDTSGSVSNELLQTFVDEAINLLETFRSQVTIIPYSVGAQTKQKLKPKQGIQITDRGGTNLSAALKGTMKDAAKADVIVILTDGYDEFPEKFMIHLRATKIFIAAPEHNPDFFEKAKKHGRVAVLGAGGNNVIRV